MMQILHNVSLWYSHSMSWRVILLFPQAIRTADRDNFVRIGTLMIYLESHEIFGAIITLVNSMKCRSGLNRNTFKSNILPLEYFS